MNFNSTHDTVVVPCTDKKVVQNDNDPLQLTSVLPTDVSSELHTVGSAEHVQNMHNVSYVNNFLLHLMRY